MVAELDLYTSIPAVIGSLLAKRRMDQALSQTDAADILDISTSSWSRIENGETSMTMDQLFAICRALELKPSAFFALVEDKIALLEEKGITVNPHKLKAKKMIKLAQSNSPKKKSSTAIMEVTGMGLWPFIGSVIFVAVPLAAGAVAVTSNSKKKRATKEKKVDEAQTEKPSPTPSKTADDVKK